MGLEDDIFETVVFFGAIYVGYRALCFLFSPRDESYRYKYYSGVSGGGSSSEIKDEQRGPSRPTKVGCSKNNPAYWERDGGIYVYHDYHGSPNPLHIGDADSLSKAEKIARHWEDDGF